ncbi:hypothetical protein [Frankia sp. QA3]|uniref:hypothetical protein n=1 Tax=Frankia sp. QA3 TaxID=710111 RepID=UPI000269C406|nr:hypothetical protein [Frankia sp. QA3]EIV93857.1 hypothetical protein FraQA3DRAFT_3574 [Frankia sp. QA3]
MRPLARQAVADQLSIALSADDHHEAQRKIVAVPVGTLPNLPIGIDGVATRLYHQADILHS